MIVHFIARALVLLLTVSASSAWADPTPHLISMDNLPHRDASANLLQVVTFTPPCNGNVRFGRGGETIIVDCAGTLPLGRHFRDPANLNTLGEDFSAGQARTAYVYDTVSGSLLRSSGYARAIDLAPLVELVADGAWTAGTNRSSSIPKLVVTVGSPATPVTLRDVRAQFIAARRMDERRVAVVYEAWEDPARNGGFPEPYVTVIDIESGAVLSEAALAWQNPGQSIAIAAAIDADGLTLFYRRFGAPPQQSDSYTGDGPHAEVLQHRFSFDGQSRGAPVAFGFDAGAVFTAGDRVLVIQGAPNGCRNVIAALRVAGVVRQCYQRSHRAAPSTGHLRRQRPTEAEQYGYSARFMAGGDFVVVVGQPGVDERARNPAAPTVTHIFNAESGRYLGASSAAATAPDAPLLATREDGRVTIWRLTP